MLIGVILPATLVAQSIPAYLPVNPLATTRSPLYSQPLTGKTAGWSWRFLVDYSSAIELAISQDQRQYLLDAELLHVDLSARRQIGPNFFALGNIALRGGYTGSLDGFFNWYHDVVGLPVPERDLRPEDEFAWRFELADTMVHRELPGTFLGDLRVGVGTYVGPAEVVASIVLPTATTDAVGWSRENVGVALTGSAKVLERKRIRLEAGLALGFSPTEGGLATYQRAWSVGARGAMWWNVLGRQALYATIWTQSGTHRHAALNAMEHAEVTIDFGGLLYLGEGWPELQLGMTEDIWPRGSALDIGFKMGLRW